MSGYERRHNREGEPVQRPDIERAQAKALGLGNGYKALGAEVITLPPIDTARYFEPDPHVPIQDFETAKRSKQPIKKGDIYGVRGTIGVDFTRRVRLDTIPKDPTTRPTVFDLGSVDSSDAVATIKANTGKPSGWVVRVEDPETFASSVFPEGMQPPLNPRLGKRSNKFPEGAFVGVEGTVKSSSPSTQRLVLTNARKDVSLTIGSTTPIRKVNGEISGVRPSHKVVGVAEVVNGELYLWNNTVTDQTSLEADVVRDQGVRARVREVKQAFLDQLNNQGSISRSERYRTGREITATLRTWPLTDKEGQEILDLEGLLQQRQVLTFSEMPYHIANTLRRHPDIAEIDTYTAKAYKSFPPDEGSTSPLLESTTVAGARNRLRRIVEEGPSIDEKLPPIGTAVQLLKHMKDGNSLAFRVVSDAIDIRLDKMQQGEHPEMQAAILEKIVQEVSSFDSSDSIKLLFRVAEASRGEHLAENKAVQDNFQHMSRNLFDTSVSLMKETIEQSLPTVQTLIPHIGELKRWQRELAQDGYQVDGLDTVVTYVSLGVQGVLYWQGELKDTETTATGRARVRRDVSGDQTERIVFSHDPDERQAREIGDRLSGIQRAGEVLRNPPRTPPQ